MLDVKKQNASRLALTELAPGSAVYAKPAADHCAWHHQQFQLFIRGFCASFICCCIL
jgi:hypothetical protein